MPRRRAPRVASSPDNLADYSARRGTNARRGERNRVVIGLWNFRGKALFRAREREIVDSRRFGSIPGYRSDCSCGISRVGTAFLSAAGLGRLLNLIIEKRNLEHDIAL